MRDKRLLELEEGLLYTISEKEHNVDYTEDGQKELSRKAKLQEGASTCVAAVFSRPDAPQVERLLDAGRRCGGLVVVSFGSPALVRDFPDAAGFVCAYGADDYCQRAAARALLGEIPFQGRLPAAPGA